MSMSVSKTMSRSISMSMSMTMNAVVTAPCTTGPLGIRAEGCGLFRVALRARVFSGGESLRSVLQIRFCSARKLSLHVSSQLMFYI